MRAMRAEMLVQEAIIQRLDGTQRALLEELRAIHSLLARVESFSLRLNPAKVSFLNSQPALSFGGRNRFSCPEAEVDG